MLEIHTENLGTTAILCLQGRIVTGETELLRSVVHSQSNTSAVILDFARVTAVDAHGLGVMLDLRAQALTKGTQFALINVNQPLKRVFEITRLDSVFQITSEVGFLAAVLHDSRAPMAA
ncbi:MAG: STAS domain-containing protein [Pyrinomonadaceae bacterium]